MLPTMKSALTQQLTSQVQLPNVKRLSGPRMRRLHLGDEATKAAVFAYR